MPSAGFGKVQSTPAASVGGNGGPGSVTGSSGVPTGNSGQDNKDAQGFAGQQQGTGKFRGGRPSKLDIPRNFYLLTHFFLF